MSFRIWWSIARCLLVPIFLAACAKPAATPISSSPEPSALPASSFTPAPPAGTPAGASPGAESVYRSIIDAPDRSPEDRALDLGRHPAELLAALGLKPGMKVGELGAGGGYTTELLARSVAPNGVVYAQNSKVVLERFAEKPWSLRLANPVMKNVVRVDRELDEPFPPEARALDAVVIVLFYHDAVWLGADRERMNQAVFHALRPGGVYLILDHSGRPGSGVSETQTLHRIEERVVREEVPRAGFRLDKELSSWRNPADTRDWNASPRTAGERRGTSDRFALVFVKP